MLDAEHEAGLPPPTAHEAQPAGHADAAPSTAPAHRSDAGEPRNAASGGAPPWGPPGTHAKSEARATTRDMPRRAADRATSGTTSGTTASKTVSMPSWSHAGVAPTRTQHRLPRVAIRSHEATIQGSHPSRCPARHTSSTITLPWGRKLGMLPPQMTGPLPQAGQRTGPRTSTAPKGAERVWRRAPKQLASLPTSHRGPPRPGGGGIQTTRTWKATPATPAPTQNRRRPKTFTYGSTGSPQGSSSPWRSASDCCLLCGPAPSRREPAPWRISPSAIARHKQPPPPWTTPASGTTWPAGSWRIWGPIAWTK